MHFYCDLYPKGAPKITKSADSELFFKQYFYKSNLAFAQQMETRVMYRARDLVMTLSNSGVMTMSNSIRHDNSINWRRGKDSFGNKCNVQFHTLVHAVCNLVLYSHPPIQ